MDTDGSGTIDCEEFCSYFAEAPAHAARGGARASPCCQGEDSAGDRARVPQRRGTARLHVLHNGGVQLGSTLVSLCGLRATKECIRARVSPKCSCPRLASLGTAEAGVRPKLTGLRAMASCTGPDS